VKFSARKKSDETRDADCRKNVRATAAANSFECEVEGPEATAETATESPENRGAAIEGVESKTSDRLKNVGR